MDDFNPKDFYEHFHQITQEHEKAVGLKLAHVLCKRYGIEDENDLQIAIDRGLFRCFEMISVPVPEVIRIRVYAYGEDYLFSDIIVNTEGGFANAQAHVHVRGFVDQIIEERQLIRKKDDSDEY
jgi:hypothetical protein